jgi:signal transduction histidine kinase
VRFEAAYPPIGKHLEVSAYPHARGLTIYFRDITENRQLAEQLAHAQRLDSLGQLTGGVAHDFNNLLTIILGSSEVLTRRLADAPDLLRLAAGIEAAAHRGASLTHSLLAFARKQPLNPTVVDVNSLVRETEELLVHTLGRPITISTVLAEGAAPCLVDSGQLGNALLNLCLNARDAMPGGGRLIVETAEVHLDGRYPDVTPGPYVTLTVTDDGPGMAPEVLDRVFEPFFTTKGLGEGSGLGLAMVYGFARQSQGHVTVSSRPGAGTTVRLYLPMATTVVGGAAR